MTVSVRWRIDDAARFAIAHQWGKERRATAREITSWIRGLVAASLEDLVSDYQQGREAGGKDQ